MKLSVNKVYRKFSRKFKRLNKPSIFSKTYSTELVLKVVTCLLFLHLVLDLLFWDMWTAELLAEYQEKIQLLETYLEVTRGQ